MKSLCKIFIINVLALFSLTIFSCQEKTPTNTEGVNGQTASPKNAFFDLKNFLESKRQTDLKSGEKVRKTVVINGKSETKELAIADWQNELRPFLNADINRPAWQDKYLRKESLLPNQDSLFEYYALRDALKVRHLIVQHDAKKENYSVKILTAEKTAATATETTLLWDSRTGYSLTSSQKLLGTTDSARIEVVFLE